MPTVLVVEDDPTLRASMVRGLAELRSVTVLAAGTVREARAFINGAVPDLVITELQLPDESGTELIAALDRLGARTPVVVASTSSHRHRLPRRQGVIAIEKPFTVAALRELVVAQLGLEDVNAAFTLTDFITLAGMGRHSVRLEVSLTGVELGEVVVVRGEAWHAHDKNGVGAEAFFRLCAVHGAAVRVQPPTDVARTLHGTCEAMLLEYFRWQDLYADGVVTGESDRPRHTLPYGGLTQLQEGDERWFSELTRAATATSSAPASATNARHAAATSVKPSGSPNVRHTTPAPTLAASLTPPAPVPAAPAAVVVDFDTLYAKGVEALLDRRYKEALDAFEAAARVGTSPSLQANLTRLRAMGVRT